MHESNRRVGLDRKIRGLRIKPWRTPAFRGCGAESEVSQKVGEKKVFKIKTT